MVKELPSRIAYLDGFRGIAIILVTLYHAYSRWPDLVPYGSEYVGFPPAYYGGLGVQLFFMISGFVIYMTLEKCSGFSEFLWRRWLRLFPAMLVVSVLIFSTAWLLPERPGGIPQLRDLIPGMLFIEPSWISTISGTPQGVLEGAFWSLFVEVKFYVIFGGVFFLAGRRWAEAVLGLCFATSFGTALVNRFIHWSILERLQIVLDEYCSFDNFGWFLIGAITYELSGKFDRRKFLLLLLLSLAVCAYSGLGCYDLTMFVSALLIVTFVGAVYSGTLKAVLATRIFVFFGFISYPFYLFHENFMIAVIRKIGSNIRPLPDFIIPIFPLMIVVLIAFLLAEYIEPFLRRILRMTGETIKGSTTPSDSKMTPSGISAPCFSTRSDRLEEKSISANIF